MNSKCLSLSRAVAMAYNAASIARSVLAPGSLVVETADRAALGLLVELVDAATNVPNVDASGEYRRNMTIAYVVADDIVAELAHGEVTDAQVRDLHEKALSEHNEAVAAGVR